MATFCNDVLLFPYFLKPNEIVVHRHISVVTCHNGIRVIKK